MKKRIILFITVYILFILFFLIGKSIFLFKSSYEGIAFSFGNAVDILYHGLPLDLSMAGYLTIIPGLLILLSIWFNNKITAKCFNVYIAIIAAVVSIITIADAVVYKFWQFHIDASVFLYLKKPKETLASTSVLETIMGFLAIIILFLIFLGICSLAVRSQIKKLNYPKSPLKSFIAQIVLILILFLPIRGGVTVSTMNVGKVYFSNNMFFNQAAINPTFNLMYSCFKSEDFAKQYQFLPKEQADSIFVALNKHAANQVPQKLLRCKKPNILLFVLESFSGIVVNDSLVAPNMHQFAKEGVSFTNFYANSFRTDRGLVSVLNGYPAQPTVAIMKYPRKTESLPSLPSTLKENGYNNLSFYYGGDADFANMRSYFIGSCGTTDIVSDKDYPIKDRLSKWGVPDHIMLNRLFNDLTEKPQQQPFYKTILTLSSHEPFDVPTRKFSEPFLNSVAYSDSCLGVFINKLKQTALWDSTLIVMVPDHCMQWYPPNIQNYDPKRFHIPLIWTGGALKDSDVQINTFGSQNDIAATILSQLDIKHDQFKFSKDLLEPSTKKFAFYSYVNGFSMRDSTAAVIYDNDKKQLLDHSGAKDLSDTAKAFFQTMYFDLGNR